MIFHYKFGVFNVMHHLNRVLSLTRFDTFVKLIQRINFKTKRTKRPTQNSTFDSINNPDRGIQFKTEIGTITLRKTQSPLHKGIKQWIATNKNACCLYLQCFTRNGFDPLNLLRLTYNNCPIGDLVASNALRRNPSSGGRLKHCKLGVFESLIDAVSFVDYSSKLCTAMHANQFVIVPERTYLDGVYQRVLHNCGVSVIENNHYTEKYIIIDSCTSLKDPIKADYYSRLIDDSTEKIIDNYMHQRVNNPGQHLKYMNQNIDWDSDLKDISGKQINTNDEKINITLYLHSFDDAQYVHGVDGFEDLFEWVSTTVNILCDHPCVSTIFVKPHPNVDYNVYPGDKKAINTLRRLFSGKTHVIWLDSGVDTNAVSKIPNVVAITHHGSIAEEMVYLGVPVIASTFAPWGTQFKFVRAWSSPSEYRYLLKDIQNNAHPVTFDETVMLKKFVFEYRLGHGDKKSSKLWKEFHGYIFGEEPRDHWEGVNRVVKYFENDCRAEANLRKFVSRQASVLVENPRQSNNSQRTARP